MSNQDMNKVGLKVCGAPDRRIQVSRRRLLYEGRNWLLRGCAPPL